MYIETVGRGPALVLIHGWALHGGVFAPLVARLAPHFQLHLVDLPGHGHSRDDATPLTLPAVVRAIAAATPPAVWLGWSLGGLVALHGAATLPQVRGLAMLAASPRFVRGDGWPHAVDAPLLAQLGRDLADDYPGTLDRFLALDLRGAGADHASLRPLRADLLARGAPAPRALHEGLALLERSDLRRALPALRVPSLWLAGGRDRLVPAAGMQQAALATPGAAARTLAGAGHAPFLSQAEQVADALQRFVPPPP
jgi:pimeloyl-[acyl-carrier protein] methyl ester esterase